MKAHVSVGFGMGWLYASFLYKAKHMPGTRIGVSVCCISFSCLRTKELGIVGEQGIVGLQ